LAILISATLGVVAGIVAATRRNSALDIAALLGSLVGISLPIFWLGLLAILIFAVKLRWLPSGGAGTLAHLVLPALVLWAASSSKASSRATIRWCRARCWWWPPPSCW